MESADERRRRSCYHPALAGGRGPGNRSGTTRLSGLRGGVLGKGRGAGRMATSTQGVEDGRIYLGDSVEGGIGVEDVGGDPRREIRRVTRRPEGYHSGNA